MRVYFSNLGCKLNQAEIEKMERDFRAAGHVVVSDLAQAQVHVVNSCTVTHAAARDSRKVARRGRRLREDIKTVLTGCYATGSPAEAAALAGVDLVISNGEKDELLRRVEGTFPGDARSTGSGYEDPVVDHRTPVGPHARAAVRVEDGCNMRCAFCVIPATRGRQRSLSVGSVVAEVKGLASAGRLEVILTGVQISSYRDGEMGLYELTSEVLARTAVPRLRLTSIAPWQFDLRLLSLWPNPRLCRHFHLSLQSGSDRTLRRMRRPYDGDRYRSLVESIRSSVTGVAVTTDVIVGFPGESHEEFRESLAFVEEMEFSKVHVFSYSPRDGTAAPSFPDQVPPAVMKERLEAMLRVAAESEQRFWRRQLGTVQEVVWETTKAGRWRGMTDNYIRVAAAASAPDVPVQLDPVRLQTIGGGGVEVARLHGGDVETGVDVVRLSGYSGSEV